MQKIGYLSDSEHRFHLSINCHLLHFPPFRTYNKLLVIALSCLDISIPFIDTNRGFRQLYNSGFRQLSDDREGARLGCHIGDFDGFKNRDTANSRRF
jgi:hypothetical protein